VEAAIYVYIYICIYIIYANIYICTYIHVLYRGGCDVCLCLYICIYICTVCIHIHIFLSFSRVLLRMYRALLRAKKSVLTCICVRQAELARLKSENKMLLTDTKELEAEKDSLQVCVGGWVDG